MSSQARRARPVAATRRGSPPLRLVHGGEPAPASRPRRSDAPEAAGRKDAARLTALCAGLTVFGLVMVAAAAPVASLEDYGSPWSLIERQLLWAVLGGLAFLVARRVRLTTVRRLAAPALMVVAALLVVVLVPHLGKGAGGASRWLGVGPLTVQPSELAKLAFAVFAADLVARREGAGDLLRELVRPLALVVCLLGILILRQPDMGTAVVLVCTGATMLFAGGVRGRQLVGVGAVMALLAGLLAIVAPYRRDRLLSFIDPFGHASSTGYQLVQSLGSLGTGHLTGAGIGSSVATWLLPNGQTDFIFAAVGSDFGLFGCLAVLLCFAAFAWLGVRVSMRAEDRFAALLATALTAWVVLQALVNMGGVTGVLPDTGIPLPFLSSGGSSLIVVLAASGLLVNLARRPRCSSAVSPRPRRAPHPAGGAPRRSSAHPAGTAVRSSGEYVARRAPRSAAAR